MYSYEAMVMIFAAASFPPEEIRTSFRVMKMTRTVFENKSGDQYTKDSV